MPKENTSQAVVGKVDQSRLARFKSAVNRHPKRKKYALVFLAVLLVVVGGVGGYLFYKSKHKPAPAEFDPYADTISSLLNQPVPAEPMEQAFYYSQIGSNYEASARDLPAKQQEPKLKKAIEYYLKAQQVADDKKLPDVAFYAAIASDYQQLGDNAKAKEYWQKQLKYLNDYKVAHPDDVSEKTIQQTQDKINQL